MINYNILAGSVDVSVVIRIIDSTDGTPETGVVFNSAGIDIQYRREGEVSTAITEVSLAALTAAHTDGGFLHIGNGYYRLDLPDAAVAAGASGCLVHGTVTGMVVIGCYIHLTPYPANVVQISGDATAADNLESYTDGTTPMPVNATQVSGDSAAADNAELFFDGTGYNAANSAIGTVASVTAVATGGITAGSIAADAIGASELAADAVAEIADAVWDEDATAHQTQGTFGQAIGDPVADPDTIWGLVNTNLNATVGSRASQASVDAIDDFVDTEIAAIITTLGTPAGASLAADIAAIEAQTDDIGAAGAGLTAVPWNAAWDAEVQSEVQDAVEVNRLDELLAADSDIDGLAPPTVGSVFHELMSATIGSFTFDQTTDSLEAIRNKETDIETDTQDIQGRLPAALVSGRIDASVGAMAAGVVTAAAIATGAIDADAIAADAVTEIQSGLSTLTAAQVNAEVDTALADYDAPTNAELVSEINSVQADIAALPSAATIATTVWAAADRQLTAISAALRNSIADNILRRAWATAAASADGDVLSGRSLLGAIARLVNRSRANAGVLTVYQADDTTSLFTQNLTTDATADPVIEADTN